MTSALEIFSLVKHFRQQGRWRPATMYTDILHAVDGISMEIANGESLGLLGNTWSGASIVGIIVAGEILPTDGGIIFNGEDITRKNGHEIKDICREHVFLVCSYFEYPCRPPLIISRHPLVMNLPFKSERAARMEESNSTVLLADTSLMPASENEHILSVLANEKRRQKSLLLVTQDLTSIARICDRIAVMYAGKIIECADTPEFLRGPLHPYSELALVYETFAEYKNLEYVEMDFGDSLKKSFTMGPPITNSIVNMFDPPTACRFHPRCPWQMEICRKKEPALKVARETPEHLVACHLRTS